MKRPKVLSWNSASSVIRSLFQVNAKPYTVCKFRVSFFKELIEELNYKSRKKVTKARKKKWRKKADQEIKIHMYNKKKEEEEKCVPY